MSKYECIRSWTRHTKGEVIEQYDYNRIPADFKETHFRKVEEKVEQQTVVIKPEPVIEQYKPVEPEVINVITPDPVEFVANIDNIISDENPNRSKRKNY